MMSMLRAVMRHRPLIWAIALGLAAAVAAAIVPNSLTPLTRALVSWDVGIAVYLGILFLHTRGIGGKEMAAHAADTDEGRYFVLFVSLAGVAASLTAIVLELQAHSEPGPAKSLHVAFVFFTVALSWVFVHASFAKHYAHEYFGPQEGGGVRKGLFFPGDEPPDFGDFFHFAFVIGVANQTADIQIASKTIRQVVTLHGISAFVFNTIILALTINLAASLF
ncbi:DUF1345 domain-containing protein [Terricaulis sp.]|uniref:DUF1345 domain-containing protein n=1 Tax=Terricaulis sp. TaxID=2768686 RepID=UPI003784BEA5